MTKYREILSLKNPRIVFLSDFSTHNRYLTFTVGLFDNNSGN